MRKLLLSLFTVVAALSMANAGEVTFDLTKPDLFGFAVPAASSGTDLNDGTFILMFYAIFFSSSSTSFFKS